MCRQGVKRRVLKDIAELQGLMRIGKHRIDQSSRDNKSACLPMHAQHLQDDCLDCSNPFILHNC